MIPTTKAPAPRAAILDQVQGKELLAGNPAFYFKVMLGGPTGSGKTQGAITLPKSVDKPLLLIDYDNRWETARDEIEAGTVKLLTLYDPDPNSPKGWEQAQALRQELWSLARKGDFPYSGVIEDGLSMMATLAMNAALKLDPKTGLGGAPAKQHYVPQITFIKNHINSMRSLPCHYVICAHFDLEKDEDDGSIKILPKVTRSLRTEIPSWFNEVYRCFRTSEERGVMRYFWETAGTGKYEFFKSTTNNKQRYWKDPVEIDFKSPPVGFERLYQARFGKEEKKDG
jgi:hypothetical protein